jgi:acetoacetate decarboxylase
MPLTRYTKTPEQIARLQRAMAEPAFLRSRSLSIRFATDQDVVAELLPAPLEPAAEPLATVSVYATGASNCVGPFNGALLNLACRFAGQDGWFCVTMPTSTDTAVIFGRELYAEPKKLAEIVLDMSRFSHARGTVARHGITYIDIRGTFDEEPQPFESETVARHYYVKFMPSADGLGFAHDPELVEVTHASRTSKLARGSGSITFRESPHDPVIDIPVLSVQGAAFSEGKTRTSAKVVAIIPGEQFLPHAFAKMDDLSLWLEPERTALA